MGYNYLRRNERLTEWPVLATTAIALGDMLYYDGTSVHPMAAFTWDSSEEVTRRNARSCFVGVSMEARTGRELAASTIVGGSGGIYSLTLTSATPKVGTLVGFDSASSLLLNQTLQVVTDPADAIGYCVKRYTAATTTVECVLFSSMDNEGGLMGRARYLTFYGDLNAAADIVTNWTFKQRVKLLSVSSIEGIGTSGNSVLTLKNGANSLDDTHTVTAAAVGTFLRTAIADANEYDIFEHDDAFDIACGGQATAGYANVIIEYMPLPLVS